MELKNKMDTYHRLRRTAIILGCFIRAIAPAWKLVISCAAGIALIGAVGFLGYIACEQMGLAKAEQAFRERAYAVQVQVEADAQKRAQEDQVKTRGSHERQHKN